MPGWMKHKLESRFVTAARRNINNLRYADDTTLMAESEEELKSLLMKVIEESEKVGLKISIKKLEIMASGPITSWQIDGETTEIVTDFIFWLQNLSGQLQTVVLLFNLIQLKPNSERGTPHGSEAVQANGRATIPPPLPLIFRAGLSPRPQFLQARTLEWVAITFFTGSSQPKDRTQVSHIAARFFTL